MASVKEEREALLIEHAALREEYEWLRKAPRSRQRREDHIAKLHAHIERLHAYVDKIQNYQPH